MTRIYAVDEAGGRTLIPSGLVVVETAAGDQMKIEAGMHRLGEVTLFAEADPDRAAVLAVRSGACNVLHITLERLNKS
ncbi:hypothetical protein CHELA1G11_11779 [Hyphomicrobiales bacterium]|nr:hypothetical protein CHELA1G11_11779 [Hyphomicrobiales bacterium]CAH1665456.1 hypothetical protein CHELA1G2_12528 [Hyphomicrobiales bacterium]